MNKYKKETIATFGFPSTPSLTNSPQTPEAYTSLSFLYNNASLYKVLSIKDNVSLLPLPSRIFFFFILSFS